MRYFLYISWVAQLMVGAGLFSVSFFIQYTILLSFLNAMFIAIALALIMVVAKVNIIIWHRYFINQLNNAYPNSIRWACFMFKTGLFGLSMLCSIVYLSSGFASSNHEIFTISIQLTNATFNWKLQIPQIISIFSVLVGLMIELGILLSFEILTVSMQSLMQKQQAFELDKQVLMAQIRNQQQMDNVKHNADIELIRSAVDKTVSKANANNSSM